MAWGAELDWLLAEAEDGREMRALAERPVLPDHLAFVWAAFRDLSADRPHGYRGWRGEIPFMSIDAYATRFGVEGDQFDRLHFLIRELDRVWLAEMRARWQAAMKKT